MNGNRWRREVNNETVQSLTYKKSLFINNLQFLINKTRLRLLKTTVQERQVRQYSVHAHVHHVLTALIAAAGCCSGRRLLPDVPWVPALRGSCSQSSCWNPSGRTEAAGRNRSGDLIRTPGFCTRST